MKLTGQEKNQSTLKISTSTIVEETEAIYLRISGHVTV
jgi:hypothetical protein